MERHNTVDGQAGPSRRGGGSATVGRRGPRVRYLALAPSGAHAASLNISPVLECVTLNGDGTFTAFFGYMNRTDATQVVAPGSDNRLNGAAAGSPPSSFDIGRHVAVFSARSSGSGNLVWKLGTRTATAGPGSSPCSTNPTVAEAPVLILLVVAPMPDDRRMGAGPAPPRRASGHGLVAYDLIHAGLRMSPNLLPRVPAGPISSTIARGPSSIANGS